MKVAIVQPYIFPYIGYFQLINAVDVFVFYDDVHFIKKGWINRNQILIEGSANMFTVPLKKASQNKLINEIELNIDKKWLELFFRKLEHSYKKAPYFSTIIELVKQVFLRECNTIADLSMASVLIISNYLEIDTAFYLSSERFSSSRGMDRADRLIGITKELGGDEYVNPNGGKELYSKAYFSSNSVKLSFIENGILTYKQFNNSFVGGLSILDVLMFNERESVINMLDKFSLNED